MRNFLLCFIVCIGIAPLCQAQFRKIPIEVTQAFKRKYPVAEKVAWRSRQDTFQATFSIYGIPFTADFTIDGLWRESTQDIQPDSLPLDVSDAFTESVYKGWTLKKAALVVTPVAPTSYRLYIEKSGIHRKYLFYSADGRLEKEALPL